MFDDLHLTTSRGTPPRSSGDGDGNEGRDTVQRVPEVAALSAEQRAVVAAINAFIGDVARSLLVVHGTSGSGKSRIRASFEPRTRFQNVITRMAGAIGARAAEIGAIEGLAGAARDWLNGRVVVLDDAGVARHADVAALRRGGARLVALLDPDQLPPTHCSHPAFKRADFVLTELAPAALADPIRAQARAFLAGKDYYDDGSTIRVKAVGGREDLAAADIVLCARDLTRQRMNLCARVARGFARGPVTADGAFDPKTAFPQEGEHISVLRSDRLCRGEIAWLEEPFKPGDTRTVLLVHDGYGSLVELNGARFPGMPSTLPERTVSNELDFAYALLVTEIQAARWPRVVLIDELRPDDPNRPRWLFSAFNAAEKALTIIRKHP